MTTPSIEKQIRDYYVSENGEWLVEKGKVKEGRMLKQACETIETLRKEYSKVWHAYLVASARATEKEKQLQERENLVADAETRLRERIESAIKSMQWLQEHLK